MQAELDLAPNTPVSIGENDAINKTVQHYIDGGKSGRSDEMKLAFHPAAMNGKSSAKSSTRIRNAFCG